MIAGQIEIQLLADIARLKKDMGDAKRVVGGAMGTIEKAIASTKAALGGLAAGFSAVAAVRKLVDVQRQFDVLNASLITATGSADNAAIAFNALQEFAATTPFALTEVTDAFVKMRNLGLDPSEAALRSYGNTASAMGKSLNQFIEAVADASTGEFERLKEFGVKARQQGDQVSLTFQGMTATIGNNAAEIQKYLKELGENEFAGAMGQRAKTLDGALSNLGDTWDSLFRQISSQSTGSIIYDSVITATGAIEDLIVIMKAMSSETEVSAKKTKELSVFQESVAVVFETISVLGVNVAYVLKGIGTELGGLAAQAAAVARLDFAGAKAIGQVMKEDAARARAQVDADTARILNARKEAAKAAQADVAGGDRLAQFGIKTDKSDGGAGKVAKETESAIKTALKYIETLKFETAQIGLNADQIKMMTAAREAAKAPTAALRMEIMELALAHDKAAKAEDERKKAFPDEEEAIKAATAARLDYLSTMESGIEKMKADVKAQKEFNDRIGLSKEAIAALDAVKLEEQATTLDGLAIKAMDKNLDEAMYGLYKAQAEELRKLAKLKRDGAEKESIVEKQEKIAAESQKVWDNFSQNVQRNLGDGLFNAMQGKFDGIGDSFKSMLQRMLADAAAANISKAIFGGSGGGSSGGMGLLGSAIGALAGGWGSWGVANAGIASEVGGFSALAASFDGGGFTGSGPRSGGIDGKGGFPAILHPNETVIDHSRGQSVEGGKQVTIAPTYRIQIDARTDQAQVRQLVEKAVQNGNAQLVERMRRERVI